VPLADSVARLRVLVDLLERWHTAAACAPTLAPAAGAVVNAMAGQAETLQRMLFEAGITPEQLAFLTELGQPDGVLRSETWALTRELCWHLRSSANQLRRRWRADAGGQPLPAPLADWLDEVESHAALG
jgi:hypothetical protein